MLIRALLLAILIASPMASLTAYAQEDAAEKQFGLAMHGAPKYTADNKHLDYANPDAPKGGKIKMAAIGTFDTINPFAIKGKAAQGLNLVYDRLMRRVWDEAFTMYPLIAESYEMPEDRSSITFHINPAARFHDGTPITADDVLFSFETLKESGRPNMRRVYKLVTKAEKQNDNSVHFAFRDGYDRETALIMAIMPVLSKSYWQDKKFDSTTLDEINLNGAYRIKNIDAGRSITYERVSDYWAKDLLPHIGHYNFDEITYEYFRDDGVAFEAFASGDQDIRRESDVAKWSNNYDFPAIKSGEIIKQALPHSRPERTRGFIFNTRRAPFDDINVREALALMFDFDWVNKNLFYGEYKQINSFFPNSEFDISDQTDREPPPSMRTRMRSADISLKAAGWNVENGKRVKKGEQMSFEILLSSPEEEKIALHYQRALERLGIKMRIRVLDTAAFRGRLNEYDFDMVSYFWQSSLSPGTEQTLYWGCQAANEPSRWNFPGICDPEIEKRTAALANTTTRAQLVDTMQKLDARLIAGHYMVPLYYIGQDYVAFNAELNHPKTTPLYGMVLETWWMDPPEE